jgi:predicted DsbA family dithiol-disulfide isomerase
MISLRIDVFSDIVCPWCFIGATRLDSVLSAWSEPLDVELTYHPFLLEPSTPLEGIVIEDMLRTKYGAEPRQMFARVEAAAKQAGLDLDLSKQRLMVPTIAAHTLLRHALEKGTQVALVKALFKAYFQDAKNVSDVGVLTELALGHGFSESEAESLLSSPEELAATRAETQEAVRLGIRGVPFFVFNGELAVSGAQQPEVFRQAIRQALGSV